MTVDLSNLPAVGQTLTVSGMTLRYNGATDTLQQGKGYDFTEIGRQGKPTEGWYITTDAERGYLTKIRI